MAVSATDQGLLPLTQASVYLGHLVGYLDYAFDEDDEFGKITCGKNGEPWLDNRDYEPCENNLVHRQVGSTSITYNQGGNILLIPLEISFPLGESRVAHEWLQCNDALQMKDLYDFKSSSYPRTLQLLHSALLY